MITFLDLNEIYTNSCAISHELYQFLCRECQNSKGTYFDGNFYETTYGIKSFILDPLTGNAILEFETASACVEFQLRYC